MAKVIIESSTHRAELEFGVLRVFSRQARTMTVTSIRPSGEVSVREVGLPLDDSEKRLLEALNAMPTFAAVRAENGDWHVDVDCGFQRWRGCAQLADVTVALVRTNFSSQQQEEIYKHMNKHPRETCPRVA